MNITIVYITHPDKQTAESISKQLLKEKLIACSNIFPINSFYTWDGKNQEDNEWISLLKTSSNNVSRIEKFILDNHPYEVPCILKIGATVNEKYGEWIHQSTYQ